MRPAFSLNLFRVQYHPCAISKSAFYFVPFLHPILPRGAVLVGRKGGRVDLSGPFMYVRSGAEEQDHDERVREAHLGAVHGAVARRLDEGEYVMVPRVECQTLQRDLSLLPPKHCQLILLFFSSFSSLPIHSPHPVLFSPLLSSPLLFSPPFFPDVMFVDIKGSRTLRLSRAADIVRWEGKRTGLFRCASVRWDLLWGEGRRARAQVRQEVVGINRIVSQLPHEEKKKKNNTGKLLILDAPKKRYRSQRKMLKEKYRDWKPCSGIWMPPAAYLSLGAALLGGRRAKQTMSLGPFSLLSARAS